MSVALAVTPASGSITAAKTLVRVDVTDGDDLLRQRIKATKAGERDMVSHEFQPSDDGKHSWDNLMFPSDGDWTLTLYNSVTDATITTLAVTVI